jgi:hypothetical protein
MLPGFSLVDSMLPGLSLVDVCGCTDLPLLLVMEFVEKGSLYSFLQSNKKTLETSDTAKSQLLSIGWDIAEVSFGRSIR